MSDERKFALFHLSLLENRTLFAIDMEKDQWLKSQLSQQFEFTHRGGRKMTWLPLDQSNGVIIGIIQQLKPVAHHAGPDVGGQEVISELWQGAYVAIDTNAHDEGQRVAVEIDNVGKPDAILKSFLSNINGRTEAPYVIEAARVFDARSFWEFAHRNNGVVRWVSFTFIPPNMWSTEAELDDELRETAAQTRAEKIKVTLRGSRGIDVNGQKVRDGVEYAERGAGEVQARGINGEPYNSEDSAKIGECPKLSGEQQGIVRSIKENIRRVFGYAD